MKRTIPFLFIALSITAKLSAQELKLNDNKFKIEKAVVATVEKKKDNFNLVNASGTSLISCEVKRYSAKLYTTGTTSDMSTWYVFKFPELGDSAQMASGSLYKEVNVPLFGPKDETFAKLYFKLGLVNADGTLNKEAAQKFREKFNQNITEEYAKKEAMETMCKEGLKEIVKRDTKKEVTVKEVSRTDIEAGKLVQITYEISQDNVVLGTVEVKGHPNTLKDESAEYDYHSGIASLDKNTGTADYEFKNSKGCLFAMYITPERNLFTYKDWVRTPTGKVIGKNQVKSRQAFITLIATYLVNSGNL